MAKFFDRLLNRSVEPTQIVGEIGTAIYGGYPDEREMDAALTGTERYRTFSNMLANTNIIAASVRYFLNLCAHSTWSFEASEADTDGMYAERVEQALTSDPKSSWARIIRRACMYRFYGFSAQEWTMIRGDEGWFTYQDIATRAQMTILRWEVEKDGTFHGITQESPQTSEEIYLPRGKLLYLVDDSLNDSPQGLGMFRHIVEASKRLKLYEDLEGLGFETDLRGIPIGRAPYAAIREAVKTKQISEEEGKKATQAIEDFITKHVKSAKKKPLGLALDSAVYQSLDAAASPSSNSQYGLELLKAGSMGFADIAKAIDRLNREIARVLGTDNMLLGQGERGSQALSVDKTSQLSLQVSSSLQEIGDGCETDLVDPLFEQNGWPKEMKPTMKAEAVQYRTPEEITKAIRDLAVSGAPITPDDPVVNDVRSLMGVSLATLTSSVEETIE